MSKNKGFTSGKYLEWLKFNTISLKRFEDILEVLKAPEYTIIHKQSDSAYGKNNFINIAFPSLKFNLKFINTCPLNVKGKTYWFIKKNKLIKKQTERINSGVPGLSERLIILASLELLFKHPYETALEKIKKDFPTLDKPNDLQKLKENINYKNLETFQYGINDKDLENFYNDFIN
jgi:hypothetical protein